MIGLFPLVIRFIAVYFTMWVFFDEGWALLLIWVGIIYVWDANHSVIGSSSRLTMISL